MKTMILRTTILSIAAGLVLSSCIRDNVDDRYAFGGDPEGSNTVTFVVNVPTAGSALDGIESKTRAGGIEQGGNGHTADGSVPEGYRNYQQDADVQTYGTDFGGYADADAETAAFETAVKAMAANYAKSPKKSVENSTAAQSGYVSPATRAITEQGTYDNEIREITILRFEPTGSNKYVDYIAVPASEITSAGNVSLKKFTLTLRKGNYKVLMLANSRETIDQFIADAPDIANTTLADFECGLKIACPGKWNSNPETDAANWKPFPMSSKAFELAIPNTRNFAQQPVELTRALAKINIIAHFDGMESMTVDNAGLKMFGALLVNRNSEGTLVPAAGWGGGTSLFDNSVVREIPSRVDPVPMLDAVDAIFEAGNTTSLLNIPEFYNSSVNRIVDQIYTFERSAPADRSEATSLILVAGSRNSISAGVWRWGGYRFFRVDLLKDNGSGVKEPVNIVRNFRYDVNITKVTSIGYTTPQEAYDHPGGVETEITAWDEEGVNEVIYNGEYQLAVDKSVIVVPYGGEAKMRVYTDYEKGWALSGTHIGSNLHYDRSTNIVSGSSVAGYSGELSPYYTTAANGSSATEVTFKMTSTVPTNGWGGAKTWNCVVSAGELHKKVTVVWLPSAQQAITNVGNGSDMPANVRPYAGAFWKSQQYGERLIRIARPTTGTVTEIDGKWSAYVLDGADWVALDTKPSTNDGLLGNDPGFDRAHKVDGSTQWAMGEMSADNPEIYFRIGLKSTYIPEPDAPARYAVVYLLMRGDPDFVADSPADGSGSSYVLYLRQGEDPDYLMRPTDAGGVLTSRPEAMKFSPYNLTADQLNAPVRATMSATANTDAGADNPGRFTDYPTQAGAFFQWAQNEDSPVLRYAWDPFSASHTGITAPHTCTYWTGGTIPAVASNETCPEGYRRANDGSTSDIVSNYSVSELRQSLFANPSTSAISPAATNISAGYYADGFFDRMTLSGSNGSQQYGVDVSRNSVSVNNRNVAHVGWIHYNPTTNASLFFPSAGVYQDNGSLINAGATGLYQTSSSNHYNQLCNLKGVVNITPAQANNVVATWEYKSYALSIRCVVDNTPTDVTKPTGGVLAPPGVLGVSAVTGTLTLRGSKEYAGTEVETDSGFGTLFPETVYLANFKWGSTIAITAQHRLDGSFDATDVVWAPAEFGSSLPGMLRNISNAADSSTRWAFVPYVSSAVSPHPSKWPQSNTSAELAAGLGDPCKLADGGAWSDYAVPTGSPWNGTAYTTTTMSYVAPLSSIYGRRDATKDVAGNDDWSMFLPLSYHRNNVGETLNRNGYYWSNTSTGSNNASLLLFTDSSLNNATTTTSRAIGAAIRCVQKPVSATSLAVSPLSHTFDWNAKTTGASQDFTVTADGPWTATVTTGSVADFTFTPGTGASISGTGASTVISGTGNGTFTIAPASDNGTATRTFTMTVTATDAPTTGATAPKTITVSQPFIMGVRNIGTAPGVIGYIHHPGYPDHHTLTMNKDNDGDDTNGIVYVAYFKFGSLVATSSENHGTFTSNDIVAWPNEWKSTTDNRVALNAEVTGSGAPAWAKVPTIASSDGMVQGQEIGTVPRATATNGLGDPCQYWDAEYFGGKGWRLPTVKENVAFVGKTTEVSSFNNQSGSLSFYTSDFPGAWTKGTNPLEDHPGLINLPVENGAGRTAFSESLPGAGCRFTSGVVGIQGLNGLYWSSTAYQNNRYGWSLESSEGTVRSASHYEYAYGFAIRCVEPPIQFQQSSASFTYAGWRIDDSNYEIPIDTEATNWTVEVVDPEDDWVRIAENNIESRYVKFDFDQYGDSQWGSIDGNYYREAEVVLRAGSRTSDPFTIRQYAALYLDLIMFGSNDGLVMNADGTVAEPMQIGTNALAGVFILSQPDWLDVYWDGSALSFSATENTGGARSGTIEIYAHFPDFSLDENYKTYKTLPPIPVTQSGI